jgi:multidrug efflux pump subunit AcrB
MGICVMRCFTIAAVGAGALLAALATHAEEPAVSRYRSVKIPEAHFQCEVPEEWHYSREEREEARIHYHGFFLQGLKADDDIGPALSVRYFAPDNTLFRGLQGYLDRQLGPSLLKPIDEKTSEVSDITVAGRPGKTFTRDTVEFFPPETLDARKIPIREEYVVVPHLGGFLVVRFEAPTRSFMVSRGALVHVLDTLRLLPETTFQSLRLTAAGVSVEAVEATITNPVEAALRDVPSLKGTWSVSTRGESVITLAVPATTELATVRSEIRRRLTALRRDLPPGTQFEFDAAVPGDEPLMTVTVSTDDALEARPVTIARLTALTKRIVHDRIVAVSGVADVVPAGPRPRYEIVIKADRLMENGVDIRDLVAAIRNEPTVAGVAAVEPPIDELTRRTVAIREDRRVTVGELVKVQLAAREPLGGAERPTDRDVTDREVRLEIRSTPDTDSGAVFRAVEQVLDDVRTTLPEGTRLKHQIAASAANLPREASDVAPERFAVEVIGSDFSKANLAAETVLDGLRSIPGLAELTVRPSNRASVRVSIRRDQALRHGYSDSDVAEIAGAVNAIIERRSIARVKGTDGLAIDTALMPDGDGTSDIGRLTVCTPRGDVVQLESIADVSFVEEPTAIHHKNGRCVVMVSGQIVRDDRASADREIKSFCGTVRLPKGCTVASVTNTAASRVHR